MDRLQQPRHAGRRDVRRVIGEVEADPHVALRSEVIDFIRPDFIQQSFQRAGVAQVSVMQREAPGIEMGVRVNLLQLHRVRRSG